MRRATTPSQTVGPFFSIGLAWADGPFAVPDGTPGLIWIRGTVFDGMGVPIVDAIVETWQADPEGHFPGWGGDVNSGGFRGYARSPTDADGRYGFRTLRPGVVPAQDGSPQAPHIDVSIFSRGLLKRLITRIYLPDNVEQNAGDPVLRAIDDPARRATLVAEPAADGYVFDIRIQGDGETVFFEL
jgi:protocatechuate 3,4-dioxygenase, alpha subunit